MEEDIEGNRYRGYLHFREEQVRDPRRTQVAMSNILMRSNQRSSDLSKPDDAFCGCYRKVPRITNCTCGEPGKVLEWVWDVNMQGNRTHLINDNKDVKFHRHFSVGTAVIRGSVPITTNQHYWEVKMTSLVYGTDMMVGIGTHDAEIEKFSNSFCSVLGIDNKTWGLSYKGSFHHQGLARSYASGFGQGSIIGVHLDMWSGTLSFYKNRQPLGIACSGLKGKILYPMVSSTAARSGMRIIHSVSFPSSLQFLCCVALRNAVPQDKNVLDAISLPRPLHTFLANNLGWLLGEDRCWNAECGNKIDDPFPEVCSSEASSGNFFKQSYTRTDSNFGEFVSHNINDAEHSVPSCSAQSFVAENSAARGFLLLAPAILVQKCDQKTTTNSDSEESAGTSTKKLKMTKGYLGFIEDPDGE